MIDPVMPDTISQTMVLYVAMSSFKGSNVYYSLEEMLMAENRKLWITVATEFITRQD